MGSRSLHIALCLSEGGAAGTVRLWVLPVPVLGIKARSTAGWPSDCLGHAGSTCVSPQGRLTGLGGEDLPTIVIVAHYDAFGVAPVSTLVHRAGKDQGHHRGTEGSGCQLPMAPPWWVTQGAPRTLDLPLSVLVTVLSLRRHRDCGNIWKRVRQLLPWWWVK